VLKSKGDANIKEMDRDEIEKEFDINLGVKAYK